MRDLEITCLQSFTGQSHARTIIAENRSAFIHKSENCKLKLERPQITIFQTSNQLLNYYQNQGVKLTLSSAFLLSLSARYRFNVFGKTTGLRAQRPGL